MNEKIAFLSILFLPEPIAVTTHVHADMDGAASVYALVRLLRKLNRDAFPLIFSASSSAKWLESEDRDYSSAVVLDTHKPSRCPIKDVPKVIIDHHKEEDSRERAVKRIDPSKASTSEMVALMFEEFGIKPDRDVAEKLLLGIIYDTNLFLHASPRSFKAAAYLRSFTGEISEFYEYRPDLSARIASLKAAQRMEISRVGDKIVAVSRVSAHESKAASDILRLGADVSIVYSDKRVVIRSREPILDKIKSAFPEAGGHDKAFVIPTDRPKEVAESVRDIVLNIWKGSDETKKR